MAESTRGGIVAVGVGSGVVEEDGPCTRDFVELLKPRVMSLVVFTGWVGVYLAPGDLHPVLAFAAVLCIAVAAGAAGAINMWYDRDIDALMVRTRHRPVPSGRVEAEAALAFGIILAVGSVTLMGLAVHWTAAALLALTIGFYVFVYTIWLKRRTPQNIVIGGAAGALPPVVGWSAVAGDVGWQALILFAIIFLWTPPHFWALSLFSRRDYERAGVPMLPVVAGEGATRRHILLYAAILWPVTMVPWAAGMAGALYALVALVMGAAYVALALAVLRDEGYGSAKRSFGFSIVYLFSLFLALIADSAVNAPV
jgi:heme o synthase